MKNYHKGFLEITYMVRERGRLDLILYPLNWQDKWPHEQAQDFVISLCDTLEKEVWNKV